MLLPLPRELSGLVIWLAMTLGILRPDLRWKPFLSCSPSGCLSITVQIYENRQRFWKNLLQISDVKTTIELCAIHQGVAVIPKRAGLRPKRWIRQTWTRRRRSVNGSHSAAYSLEILQRFWQLFTRFSKFGLKSALLFAPVFNVLFTKGNKALSRG